MKRCLLSLLLLLATAGLAPEPAHAQAYRQRAPIGRPVAFRQTPVLRRGAYYEIQTVLPSGGDTVLSLFRPGGTTAIRGADACLLDLGPSCVRVYMDPVEFPTPTRLNIMVRAWNNATHGVGDIRIQEMPDATSLAFGSAACPPGTVGLGCWLTWSGVTFGGLVHGAGTPTARAHFETHQIPGATWHPVHLWATPDNSNYETNWRARRIDEIHRSLVYGTSEYQGPWPAPDTEAIVAGPILGAPNPFELLRNDHGIFAGVPFGVDFDGDGLGRELEHTHLATCDSPLGPTLNGLSCSGLPGCGGPPDANPALCRAALRDSDRDGYEDALELYGYHTSSTDATTHLARFGANPAKYDVFVEVDVGWRWSGLRFPTCVYDDATYPDFRELSQLVRGFRNATMASFPNRAGGPGIEVHLDIPSTPVRPDVPVPANDANVGSWGGATCVRPPNCLSDADCNFGTHTTGRCGPVHPSSGERQCSAYDEPGVNMRPSRRWLFHRSVQLPRDQEVSSSYFAQGGGNSDTSVVAYRGSFAFVATQNYCTGHAALLHELGHHAGLHHNGPAFGDADQPGRADFNFRPNYYSRINYAYTYLGQYHTPSLAGPPGDGEPEGELSPVRNADWDRVSFSSGTTPTLDPLGVRERNVFTSPLFDPDPFETWRGVIGLFGPTHWDVTPALGVDWDRSGGPLLAATQSEEARLFLVTARTRRAPPPTATSLVPHTRMVLLDSPADMVVQGTTAWIFRAAWEHVNQPRAMTVSTNTAMPCRNEPNATGGTFLDCDIENGSENALVDAALSTNVDPIAFGVTDTAGQTIRGALVVWSRRGPVPGELRWGLLPAGAGGASLSPSGVIAGVAPAAIDGGQVIAVSRVGGGQAVSVVYRSGNELRESVMTWVGDTPSWSLPAAVSPTVTYPVLDGTGPGMTTVEGIAGVPNGLLLAVRNAYALNAINLYFRPATAPAGSGWSLAGSMPLPTENVLRGAPRVEFTRFRRGSSTAWHVNVAALVNGQPVYQRSMTNSFTFDASAWRLEDFDQTTRGPDDDGNYPVGDFAPWAPSLTWDDRTGTDVVRGVRGFHQSLVTARPCDECTPGQTCSACLQHEQCVEFGDAQFCATGFLPAGVITCEGGIDDCPSGYECVQLGERSTSRFCTLDGYLASVERRLPAADGLVPGVHRSLDDWRMLRQGFCLAMREQRALAPVGAVIPGTSIAYSDPAPGAESSTCTFATY